MASAELKLLPSEVIFLQTLQGSESSTVYKVAVHGMECVMKVFHERPREEWDRPDIEVSLCMREVAAYQRLKEKGLCARGDVPDFYGFMVDIDTTQWPTLSAFGYDEMSPKAILIEYVPDMKQIDLTNYTKARVDKLRDILLEMHDMRIMHNDTYPRNMMICSGEKERVLWIDFDVARLFPEDKPLTERQEEMFAWDVGMMDCFAKAMAADAVEGKIHKAWPCYYDGTYTFWKRVEMGLPGWPEPDEAQKPRA
ncbi:uncharacterized protein BO97DRAFT_477223 [Aspergillus homomorphus CBS 101889]|uniref:Protein kinase domain-containing protein n=1 Tax=Aspergillus homomorphus (strain CBS 101889) TaxID=1450537 RepID=A0A395I089_ASPHC|nr:hypothetical protein BO97DRAFT_477223 [Aspergillus homomorphus CBS 101889]RAL13347.1 hypothetical protein BO97DRAFT_477223 [Aspergillus homomorphus CBS 101889]